MSYRRIGLIAVIVCCALWGVAQMFVFQASPSLELPNFAPQNTLITGGLPDNPAATKIQPGADVTPTTEPPVQAPTDTEKTNNVNSAPKAPVTPLGELIETLEDLKKQIDKLETAIEDQPRDDAFLASTQSKLIEISKSAENTADKLNPKLGDVKNQIEKLGPKPKDEETPESDQIQKERERLTDEKSQIAGALKASELAVERVRQLSGRAQDLRQRIFAEAVLARGRSPLSPSLWRDVARELPPGFNQLVSLFSSWGNTLKGRWHFGLAVFVLALLTFDVLRRVMKYLRRRGLARDNGQDPETFFQRALAACWVTATLLVPGTLGTCALYFGFDALELMPVEVNQLAKISLLAVVIVLTVWALSYAILQPRRPAWRLFDLPSLSAKRLARIFTAMATIYGLDLVFQDLMQALFLPLPVRVAEAAIVTLASSALLISLVRTPLAERGRTTNLNDTGNDDEATQEGLFERATTRGRMSPWWLKWPALLLSIAMAAAAVLGYVALGRFVAGQVIVTGCVVVVGSLLLLAIRALTRQFGDLKDRPLECALRMHMRLTEMQARLLTRASSLILQASLPFLAVPVLFVSWGYSLSDALGWLKSLFFGFQVGQFRISIVQMMLAAGLFVAILFLTRLMQRGVTARLMQPGSFDRGVAHSIHTGIGYLGIVLAVLAAVSYAGFDITNLAIVAGALSIGIGFGLQSIVNNFVSGLIILFERPIKVGDWVSVNTYEGHVRRISVRSTEIETFDRTNVIVPNSEFIANPIVNLTHRNAMGRVVIPVGVSYQSDPEFVRNLLKDVAEACPEVLQSPSPLVSFDGFGDSSLDFNVRAYIDNINNRLSVATDLRMRIFKALGEAGIEIPFPQQDVHMRDLDPVRSMLQRAALQKARQTVSGSDDPSS